MDQKMSVRNKSAIFLGLVAVAAIVAGAIIHNQSNAPQAESPALTVSRQRAKTQSPAKNKTPVKSPVNGGK